MADIYKIYKKDGSALESNGMGVEVRKGEIEGQFLGQETLTFSLKSAYPIPFEVGEYVEIDGARYTLNYIPTCKVQARKGTYGEAYVYDNIVMNWEADALTRIKFLDYVLADNEIHFSNLPTVYFYGDVIDLCDRIKANIDRVYPNQWTITIDDALKVDKRGGKLKQKHLTLTDVTCWETLTKLWDEFECLFYIRGKEIKVGMAATMVSHTFKYGMGNGLKSITKQSSEDNAIITRLYTYGSQKNLLYRYYNKFDGVSDSMFIDHLMLPAIREPEGAWYFGVNEAGEIVGYDVSDAQPYGRRFDLGAEAPDDALYRMVKKGSGKTLNMYLESIAAVEKYGVMESVVTFDNDSDTYFVDLVDDENGIYPHITDATGAIVRAEQISDAGIYDESGRITPSTFDLEVNLDFNLYESLLPGQTASIAMKSGKLTGREFEFNASRVGTSGNHFVLTCNRVADNAVGRAFPYKDNNADYNAKTGDKFVLLNIQQPESYVKKAEVRLLWAGLAYMMNFDHTKSTYSPELDNIYLARHADIAEELRAGNVFAFEEGVGVVTPPNVGDETQVISLPIQQMKMKFGEELIRRYEIILAESVDVKSDLVQRTVSAVSKAIKESTAQVDFSLLDKSYIRKNREDTAQREIRFAEGIGIHDGEYYFNDDGEIKARRIDAAAVVTDDLNVTGTATTTNIDNTEGITTKDLTVTGSAHFFELVIDKARATNGMMVQSPANASIVKVGARLLSQKYDLYFLAENDGVSITNDFLVGDQIYCQTFNVDAAEQRFYWVLCTDVGASPEPVPLSINGEGVEKMCHRITVDFDRCASNCNARPQIGDNVVVLGHQRVGNSVLARETGNTTYDVDASSATAMVGVQRGSGAYQFPVRVNYGGDAADRSSATIISSVASGFLGLRQTEADGLGTHPLLKAPMFVQLQNITSFSISPVRNNGNIISDGYNSFKGNFVSKTLGQSLDDVISQGVTLQNDFNTIIGEVVYDAVTKKPIGFGGIANSITDNKISSALYVGGREKYAKVEAAVLKNDDGTLQSKVVLEGDKLEIRTDNFKLDDEGNVDVSGDVTCQSLEYTQHSEYDIKEDDDGRRYIHINNESFVVMPSGIVFLRLPWLKAEHTREIICFKQITGLMDFLPTNNARALRAPIDSSVDDGEVSAPEDDEQMQEPEYNQGTILPDNGGSGSEQALDVVPITAFCDEEKVGSRVTRNGVIICRSNSVNWQVSDTVTLKGVGFKFLGYRPANSVTTYWTIHSYDSMVHNPNG